MGHGDRRKCKCCLKLGDALKLPLAPQIGLELGKDAKHVEKAARVDRLFRRPERGATRLDGPHDVLKVANGSAPAGQSASP